MASVNCAVVLGNLGQDPEIRNFPDGGKVASLTVATSRKWKTREGEEREKTEWHRVSITADGLAGIAQKYLKKGSKVYLEGRLETRKWQDKTGVERYTTEIIVAAYDGKLVLLGDARGGGHSGDPGATPDESVRSAAPDLDDEIPF